MKILIISHMYPSAFNEITGIFVHQQVKELIKQGCQVEVICPVPATPFPIKYLSKKWRKYSEIPQNTRLEGVKIFYPRYLSFPRAFFFENSGKMMYRGIKKVVNNIYNKGFKFDLIHAHVALPDGYAGMKIAKKYKKPLVVTIHGQSFHTIIFRNIECKKNIEKVIDYSNKTIVVSDTLKTIGARNLKIDAKKMLVINNGVDLGEINFNTLKGYFKKYKNKRMILSIGCLHERKGHKEMVEAISRLVKKYPDIIYLIGGDGNEEINLKKMVEVKNLGRHIRFLGRVDREEVMYLMSICEVFALPSWDEGFGVVYIEAMAHGKPTIACRGEGIDGVIKNKETGMLVPSKNVSKLTEAIDYLLLNPDEAKNIGKQAKEKILKNYTWEKISRKIINLYKSIIINKT